ncbi:hypothetical protein PR048_021751 [Dryococelus australis]|uniref:Uncharacterized protein n=1 Tax=Dryococelus australis TaxID=614101 RepID=A0ABQ9GZ68_9NEOP|nr:hypothetical protein PR048_021751 [Dryococelus australis]
MPPVSGFSRRSPVFPVLAFGAAPFSSHFAPIGSRDLDVKSHPDIFIPLHCSAVDFLGIKVIKGHGHWVKFKAMGPGRSHLDLLAQTPHNHSETLLLAGYTHNLVSVWLSFVMIFL